jgi:uncharacterized protein (DUF1778 family)
MPQVQRVKCPRKEERLEARITPTQKDLIERAAVLRGTSVTEFVVASAQEAATITIRDFDVLRLQDTTSAGSAEHAAPGGNARRTASGPRRGCATRESRCGTRATPPRGTCRSRAWRRSASWRSRVTSRIPCLTSPHCERVFVDDHGAPQRYDAILEDFQQACKRAKIVDGFTDSNNGTRLPGFHDLRRTFARVTNCAGVPHGIIMEIAGWKSEAMLLLYRGNSQPAEQRAAFKRLASGV